MSPGCHTQLDERGEDHRPESNRRRHGYIRGVWTGRQRRFGLSRQDHPTKTTPREPPAASKDPESLERARVSLRLWRRYRLRWSLDESLPCPGTSQMEID